MMKRLQALELARPVQKPRVSSDIVYSMGMLDNWGQLEQFILVFAFKFNDVLDPDKLRVSLTRLLEIGDWRKLGGRLRYNVADNDFEIHVPAEYTDERPVLAYTHQTFNMKTADHPIASKFPHRTDGHSISSEYGDLRELCRHPDAPGTIAELVQSDHPVLSLHVSSSQDATIVGLLWPHSLMDAMGQHEILHAWFILMAGRQSEVPPLLGTDQDLSRMAGDPDVPVKEPWHLEQQAITRFGTLVFFIRSAWNLLFGPKVYSQTIIVPGASVTKLMAKARSDIKNSSEEVPFVSEGDVITGWLSKVAARTEGYRNGQSLRTMVNLRFWLPSLLQPGGTYVQNPVATAFTTVTPEFLKSSTLGDIALRHRQSLALNIAEDQLRSFMKKARSQLEKSRSAPLLMIGPSTYDMMVFTNWTKARFSHTADFSAAVVRRGDDSGSRRNPPGTVVGIQMLEQQPGLTLKGFTVIMGKDYNGDYWIKRFMTEAGWAALEEHLRELAR